MATSGLDSGLFIFSRLVYNIFWLTIMLRHIILVPEFVYFKYTRNQTMSLSHCRVDRPLFKKQISEQVGSCTGKYQEDLRCDSQDNVLAPRDMHPRYGE